MLPFRRVIAFSSRVHTYLLVLYLFFALIYLFTLIFPSQSELITIVNYALVLISWTIIFEGVWIALASIYQFFYSKVFVVSPVILTILRVALCLLLSFIIDILERLISSGGSF